MRFLLRIIILTSFASFLLRPASAQGQYSNYITAIQKIEALGKRNPSLCSARSIAKTEGGKEIMVITIGTGDRENKPGIAVVGGVEGAYVIGKELALGFAESLIRESSSPEIKALLEKVTFYVFPDVSPDATEQFFQNLKYERSVNVRPVDEDRDFFFDEDPYEDLNSDGYITLIRVSDPAGTYTESNEDKRVMVPADLSKGERGLFFVYSEGVDNDKDGKYNEDGQGGVNFNRNLSFNYEEFGTNAGLHPVSEPETKALLDFLFDHYNIYATFTFGPQDNLSQPVKTGERTSATQVPQQVQSSDQTFRMGERKITAVQKSDETVIKLVADKYREITGVKGASPVKTAPGNFADWAYYHYGRYSFSTPAWWFPVEKDKNTEAAFLKYAEENKMEDVSVPWTEIKHPDFPERKTETGGIKPFAMINPPAEKLDELIRSNYKFITTVAAMHPELEFIDVLTENMGDNIFRVSVKIHNKGIFATCAEAGQNNMWTRLMRLNFEPDKSQSLLSGQKVQRIQRLEGDGVVEFSWLIMGKGTINISAGAVNTGFVKTAVELK
jgi:hypothetical protein